MQIFFSMKKVAILTNFNAGRGRSRDAVRAAQHALWGWDVEVMHPKSEADLQRITAELDPKIYRAAVVVGGDGTVNHALRGLVSSGVPLCPFPAGTANDLARELDIQADWEQIQGLLDSGWNDRMDVIEVNGIPFVTVAGLGLGAKLTKEFNELRKCSTVFRQVYRLLESQIYQALSVKTILWNGVGARHIHVRADSFDEKIRTAVVFVCNQAFLGSNLMVAPHTKNDDRKFHVLVVPKLNRLSMLRGMMEMRAGRLPENFIIFSTDSLRLKSLDGAPLMVFGDGETLTESHELEFKIRPKSLSVLRRGIPA